MDSSEMEIKPPELMKMDDRAHRARSIIVIVMAVLIAAPLVMYLVVGSGFGARR
jgi:hypothetical protein